jgi:hypothetical protein
MMRVVLAGLLLSAQWQQNPDMAMVTIDGKTDAVPEYRAWLAAFRTLDSGSNLGVPSVLEDVLTKREQQLLLREAQRIVKHQTECWDRLAAAREPLAKLEAAKRPQAEWVAVGKEIAPKLWEIELACRWDTLHGRNRVIATFTPGRLQTARSALATDPCVTLRAACRTRARRRRTRCPIYRPDAPLCRDGHL